MGVDRSITLPWPDKRLSPNARVHYLTKSKVFREAKKTAWAIAIKNRFRLEPDAHLIMTFHAPSRRLYDLDNLLSATKASLDGLANASQCDDAGWSYTIQKGEPNPPEGCVRISVGRLTNTSDGE